LRHFSTISLPIFPSPIAPPTSGALFDNASFIGFFSFFPFLVKVPFYRGRAFGFLSTELRLSPKKFLVFLLVHPIVRKISKRRSDLFAPQAYSLDTFSRPLLKGPSHGLDPFEGVVVGRLSMNVLLTVHSADSKALKSLWVKRASRCFSVNL